MLLSPLIGHGFFNRFRCNSGYWVSLRSSIEGLEIYVCSSLDNDVSDMSVKAPKGLFPPEPVTYKGPKLKVAIIGAGLAGMSTAVELLDQGHEDGREEIIQGWYMDDSEEDQRLRFHKDPKEFVSFDKLAEIDKLIGWTSKFLAWSVRRIVFISFIG